MMNSIFGVRRPVPPVIQAALFWIAGIAWMFGAPRQAIAARLHLVQVNVSDPASAARWYVDQLGGRPIDGETVPSVEFGAIRLRFTRAAGHVPGSVGSGVDHIGFGYADLDGAIRRFARSGVHIVSGVEQEGPIRYAFIKDPWGTLIEVVEDRELQGLHHLHLATTAPKATLNWYVEAFGGKIDRYRGRIGGIRYGDVWILVKTVKRPLAATPGRAIDRIGWTVPDLEAAEKAFSSRGVKVVRGRSGNAVRDIYVDGPDGVRIEVLAPPRQSKHTLSQER